MSVLRGGGLLLSMKTNFFFFLFVIFFTHLSIANASPVSAHKIHRAPGIVWGFDFIGDSKIIYTLKKGDMALLDLQSKKTTPIKNVPEIWKHGQGGLMDVAVHPDFPKNPWIYLAYTVKVDKAGETRIARAKLDKDQLTDIEILFTSNSESRGGRHFGSRIVFDGQGHIFFAVGDRGQRQDAQKLEKANGKIHRIRENGEIPNDNPFVKTKGAESVWSYGHRNPQGLYYSTKKQMLWEQEHGPQGGDEINMVTKGKNYGWPVISYGEEYGGGKIGPTAKDGMEQPIYHFTPSIAPSGLAIYKGWVYSGALKLTHLNRISVQGNKIVEQRLLENLGERIRHVRRGPKKDLYISTDSGKIFRVEVKDLKPKS